MVVINLPQWKSSYLEVSSVQASTNPNPKIFLGFYDLSLLLIFISDD